MCDWAVWVCHVCYGRIPMAHIDANWGRITIGYVEILYQILRHLK